MILDAIESLQNELLEQENWSVEQRKQVLKAFKVLIAEVKENYVDKTMEGWNSMKDAPRDRYIRLSDGEGVEDIAQWQARIAGYADRFGVWWPAIAEGWFSMRGGRSRLDGRAKCWKVLEELPEDVG